MASVVRQMVVGVDIGGTFTDVVCVDTVEGTIQFAKVMTNYADIVQGVLDGVDRILRDTGATRKDVARIAHGTTVATNVVVQRKGARTAVFTTQGFEDVLEIGRLRRKNMYDLNIDVQTPVFLSPKRFRVGVPERMTHEGEVLIPLDEEFVARSIVELHEVHDIESVAIAYLHSYRDNRHEIRTREIVKSIYPDLHVSISSEVNPIFREYERTMVTAFDAYMRPSIERFMQSLEEKMLNHGLQAEIHVMQSRGGVTSTRMAAKRPVNLFLSGPAGGVVGAAELAASVGYSDVVTIDIGGTSSDVALITDGVPAVNPSGEIGGFNVPLSMVGVNTIGAGGGSVLWVDGGGMLRVGPRSAGSTPGPACYGRGGVEPTITDASLLLGYLNPNAFAGGEMRLDSTAALAAIEELTAKVGMKPVELALGAHRIMNVQMAEQIRLITIKQGYDPREFMLMAFGGAGPLHAGALISMLGMKGCIIPPMPGVLSAYGLLSANVEVEQQLSVLKDVQGITEGSLRESYGELQRRCLEVMREDGMRLDDVGFRLSADMRYQGQSHEIEIPLAGTEVTAETALLLDLSYRAQYQRLYGFTNKSAVEVVNLRAVAFRRFQRPKDLRLAKARSPGGHRGREADVWFLGASHPLRTPFMQRETLSVGERIEGPAVVEQSDTTTVIYPGQHAQVDQHNNLVITGVSRAYSL